MKRCLVRWIMIEAVFFIFLFFYIFLWVVANHKSLTGHSRWGLKSGKGEKRRYKQNEGGSLTSPCTKLDLPYHLFLNFPIIGLICPIIDPVITMKMCSIPHCTISSPIFCHKPPNWRLSIFIYLFFQTRFKWEKCSWKYDISLYKLMLICFYTGQRQVDGRTKACF